MKQYAVSSSASQATPTCAIVSERTLKQYFHNLLCTCEQPWESCELDDVVRLCNSMDDKETWTYDGHRWEFPFCDGVIDVTLVTELSVTDGMVNAELERWAREYAAYSVANGLHAGIIRDAERVCNHSYAAQRTALEHLILFLRNGGQKEGQTCP